MSDADGPGARPLSRRRTLALLGGVAATAARPVGAAPPPLQPGIRTPGGALSKLSGTFTLRNATVLLSSGRRVAHGGIRVEDGTVVEVGNGVRSGHDLQGAWVVPGFTDAGCTLGLIEVGLEPASRDDAEGTESVTPDARVWDGYNPRSALIPVARTGGITSVLVHPSTTGLVSGQAAIFRTTGEHVSDALVRAPAAMCINLGKSGTGGGNGAPGSRLGVGMKLRALLDAVEVPPDDADGESEAESGGWPWQRNRGGDGDKADDEGPETAGDKALLAVRTGRVKALIKAERADDILFALDLIAAYGLDGVLLGCAEGHLVAEEIAAAGVPVCLGPTTVQPNSFEHLHAVYENPALLHAAGVTLAFRTGSAHAVRTLPTLAGTAVAHGLPYEAAIAGLCRGVHDIFGPPIAAPADEDAHTMPVTASAQLGGLRPGAPADFFVAAGDPLQPQHDIFQLWTGGVPADMQTHQTRLYERFKTLD